ncbi:MAG: hypothetical protein ACREH4_16050 [Vitreimonas sp.]
MAVVSLLEAVVEEEVASSDRARPGRCSGARLHHAQAVSTWSKQRRSAMLEAWADIAQLSPRHWARFTQPS